VIYQDARPELKSVAEQFDFAELIDQVVIGPRAEEFIVEAVTAVTKKFLPQKSVRQSTLFQRPMRASRGG
jgi:hypothetical protein